MKKQVKKLSIKTDKIVNLSRNNAQDVIGGRRPESVTVCYCHSDVCQTQICP